MKAIHIHNHTATTTTTTTTTTTHPHHGLTKDTMVGCCGGGGGIHMAHRIINVHRMVMKLLIGTVGGDMIMVVIV